LPRRLLLDGLRDRGAGGHGGCGARVPPEAQLGKLLIRPISAQPLDADELGFMRT
jgi:hypothetical protein